MLTEQQLKKCFNNHGLCFNDVKCIEGHWFAMDVRDGSMRGALLVRRYQEDYLYIRLHIKFVIVNDSREEVISSTSERHKEAPKIKNLERGPDAKHRTSMWINNDPRFNRVLWNARSKEAMQIVKDAKTMERKGWL
jgi:hypothetical protein